MATSPSTLNYSVLRGIVKFTPTGGVERDLGNAPEFELTPAIEKLDHFSSRAGVRSKDKSVVLEKTLTARIVLDEITAENLNMALIGDTVVTNSEGNKEFGIYAESEITGRLTFTGTNDVGNRVHAVFPSVSFTPSGSLNLISEDDWQTMELTCEILFVEALDDFGTVEVEEVESA